MHKLFVRTVLGVLLAAAVSLSGTRAGVASADTAGTVHFLRSADSSFDQFTSNPTETTQEWLRGHMWRMITWSPYFDQKTSWYPNAWVYDDSYAIYRGSALASAHPEWILKDAAGRPLYIPSGCSGSSCPQYAGDIGNPAFRAAWIAELKEQVAQGYRGVFIDDVNMEMQVSNGNEEIVAPIDPSTGKPMTSEAWRGYMAHFMQEVRAQLPDIEIAHNAIWYADEHAGTSNANIRTEIESANYIFLERGANDAGLTGGEGQWSLKALLSYVDQVHALGRDVVIDGTSSEPQGLTYNLASYFLISNGNDAVSGDGQTPENWWSGWNVNLGEASGPRYSWGHLLRRDFAGGMVLVNQPGEPTETVSLPAPMQNAEGVTVTSVTLAPGTGAVLRGTTLATAPASAAAVTEAPSEASALGGASSFADSSAADSSAADSAAADVSAGGGSTGTAPSLVAGMPTPTGRHRGASSRGRTRQRTQSPDARTARFRRARAARRWRLRHRTTAAARRGRTPSAVH